MKRAYAVLTVKAVGDDERIITGTATTPTPDRVGDIIDPLGAEYTNPMPLLWQHRSDQPVGTVTFKKPTKEGINFTARLPEIEIPGPLKDRVDTAWGEIKAGLVRAVSIGFRPLESSVMEDGGIHFLRVEVLETSLVTIPANIDATIQTIKRFDLEAAPGHDEIEPVKRPAPGEMSKTKPKAKEPRQMKTTQERLSAFEAKRAAKSARMTEIMAENDTETLDKPAQDEVDAIIFDIKEIDEHLVRLNECAKAEQYTAKAVNGSSPETAAESRRPDVAPRVSVRDVSLPKGVAFGRFMRCKALGKIDQTSPLEIARELYPDHSELQAVLKTAVAAGTTTVSGWASQLVNTSSIFADFVEYLRPMTVLGQFGTNGIPSLRRVPFRTILISQTAGTSGSWVGEGQPKPVSKPTFASTSLIPYKVAAISVATMELLRDSSPSVEGILRDDLARAVAAKIDTDFLDPQKGLEANVSPASISNGVTPINSSGRDADSVRADLVSAFAAYIAVNNTPSSGVWVMSAITALQLSLLTNALGQPEFPGMRMTGGTLQGLPVITSEFIGQTTDSPTEGRDVFLVNASDIWFADDGGVDVAMSTEAALEMLDNPTNASGPSTVATSMVSLWQTNSVGFRAERTVSWARRRTESVQQLAQVEWGEASGVNV